MIPKTNEQHLARPSEFFNDQIMSLKEFWSIGSEYLNLIRTALVMLANFLLVEEWTINGLLLLMALDTLTGSAKAIRLRKNFTFKNLFWGFTTKILVLIIPVTS